MTEAARNHNVLKSWKEIAAYFDVSVRTCLRYEAKYGLPIHRINQSAKSAIFAYKDELDEWLSRRPANGRLQGDDDARAADMPEPEGQLNAPWAPASARASMGKPTRRGIYALALISAVAALAAALMFFLRAFPARPAEPANFKIEGSELVVTDRDGSELWRFDTKLPNLAKDEYSQAS